MLVRRVHTIPDVPRRLRRTRYRASSQSPFGALASPSPLLLGEREPEPHTRAPAHASHSDAGVRARAGAAPFREVETRHEKSIQA